MKSQYKSNRLKIGLDLDGVIADHTENKQKLSKLFGFKISKANAHSERIKDLLPRKIYKKIERLIYGPLAKKAKPVVGAIRGIKNLRRESAEIFVISKRSNRKTALVWLSRYGFLRYIPKRNIFLGVNENQKNKIARKLGIRVFLDDKSGVLQNFKEDTILFLFNPYQTKLRSGPWIEIKSWKSFVARIKKEV